MVNTHLVALLLAGKPIPMIGRLLADTTQAGEVVPLDPDSGEEAKDDRPAFILSTENEASDGHIVRQHWNLSRGSGAGIPVLWNHNQDVLLGQWQDLGVRALKNGPALVGRAFFDPDDELAQKRRRQIRSGMLSAVSTGWIPGERTRRGELDPTDPLYREAVDGMCGPEEGMVMGTEAHPNVLVETSIVPCPAQAEAIVMERLHRRGEAQLQHFTRSPGDLDSLLATLAQHPQVRRYIDRLVEHKVRAILANSTPSVTVADMFRS